MNKTKMKLPLFAPFSNGLSSSEDKRKFAENFIRFVESDFLRNKFTKTFYGQLSNTFGYIAHCDIHGFYAAQFSSRTRQINFVKQSLQYPCDGSADYTFSDVEAYLKDWLNRTGVLNRLLSAERSENIQSERNELARLRAKFEPTASG